MKECLLVTDIQIPDPGSEAAKRDRFFVPAEFSYVSYI